MDHTALNPSKMEEFGALMLGILNKAGTALMLSVGHRTGLFDTMAGLAPSTAGQIADAAGLKERYVREWLGAVVTGGVVEHDPERGTYHLPPEHAAFLTRAAQTNNMASFAQILPILGSVEDGIVACFRQGGGVPYSSFKRFPEVMREMSAPTFDTLLIDKMLPLAPGLVNALQQGIDVLEVGCGCGRATNVMAKAFPNSRFIGYDLLPDQIAVARAESASWGLSNVQFETRDVATLADKEHFGLVLAFDTVHDQARPAELLTHIAASLKPGGVFLMWDVGASSDLHKNMDHMLGPFMYAVSCMHCMTVSLSQNGVGLGAMWGREKAGEMLEAAGFSGTQVHSLEEDPVNCCYITYKA